MICFDSDDFGANHVISDMCQSHDCRDMLLSFKQANPLFKATLFAIPGEMTQELVNWCFENVNWIELAHHGFYHTSNYECAELSYFDFEHQMKFDTSRRMTTLFVKGFKAPGWQISDGVREWLMDNGYWLADHVQNEDKREMFPNLKTYLVNENSIHTHTWDCVGNGVYELHDQIIERIKNETDFKFVSELV